LVDVPPLYKFLSVDAANAVLANGSLRWSTPGRLNDPFDVQTALTIAATDEEVVDLAVQILRAGAKSGLPAKNVVGHLTNWMIANGIALTDQLINEEFKPALFDSMKGLRSHLPTFCEEILAGLSSSKYLCLTSRRDQSIMWSHYADGHRGAALEFQAKRGVDSAVRMAKPINYLHEPPHFADAKTLAAVLAGIEDFGLRQLIDKFVYSKGVEWEYEQEWRIDSSAGRDPNAEFEDVRFFESDLTASLLGCAPARMIKLVGSIWLEDSTWP
jgi:hypothetical protein